MGNGSARWQRVCRSQSTERGSAKPKTWEFAYGEPLGVHLLDNNY